MLLVVLSTVLSCEKDNELSSNKPLDFEAYAKQLRSSLDIVATNLRKESSTFKDVERVKSIAEAKINNSDFSDFEQDYREVFEKQDMLPLRKGASHPLSSVASEIVNLINQTRKESKKPLEFVSFLDEQLISIKSNIQLSEQEKAKLLLGIYNEKTLIEFAVKNLDIVDPKTKKITPLKNIACGMGENRSRYSEYGSNSNIKCQQEQVPVEDGGGWWNSWGKCAAGVAGNATIYGVAGFVFGPWGAVIGAIGGGLHELGNNEHC